MGAWGPGIFENDEALDWVIDLEGTKDYSMVNDALETVNSGAGGYLESPDCSNALAAAEVVAALAGNPAPDLPDEVISWLKGKKAADAKLIKSAKSAVSAIARESELRELWKESDEYGSWKEVISDLKQRLS